MLHALRTQVSAQPIISNSQALLDYLRLDQAHAPNERFRVLYLNARNCLVGETVQEGSVSDAPVYPREIIRKALDCGATALVLVHNHPSGDHAPSAADISITRTLADAARQLEIRIHDHLVVSPGGAASFRLMGLL